MAWEAAYEEKIAIWKFWTSMTGRSYGRRFGDSMIRKNNISDKSPVYTDVAKHEATKMMVADPIWISEEMMDVWEATVTVPEEKAFQPEPLLQEDFFIPNGFVLFPRPMITIDSLGKKMSYRAISWAMAGLEDEEGRYHGINLSFYTHAQDPDDYFTPEDQAATGIDLGELTRGSGTLLSLSHLTPWPFGQSFDRLISASHRAQHRYEAQDMQKSWSGLWIEVQALLRLMNQRMTSISDEKAPRETRRRAKRIDMDESPVKVVKLRRAPSKPTGDEREVKWTHRWMVDGHWRQQWYPSINDHRQIWISSYVKGPESLELKVKPVKAYELVR